MAALRDAFMNGRERAGARSKTADGPQAEHPASTFGDGAEWVRRVLVPAIDRGNAELQPLHIAFQLDLNLDPRSTNHAHADFWLSERGEGQRAVGSKYSVNVLRGQNVWLYSPVRRGGISAPSIAAGPMRSRRCSRTPPRSSAGLRGDGAIRHPVAQGCRPVSRSIETKANAASASEKYTVFVTTSVTTSFLVTIASSNPVSRDST